MPHNVLGALAAKDGVLAEAHHDLVRTLLRPKPRVRAAFAGSDHLVDDIIVPPPSHLVPVRELRNLPAFEHQIEASVVALGIVVRGEPPPCRYGVVAVQALNIASMQSAGSSRREQQQEGERAHGVGTERSAVYALLRAV